MAEGAIAKKAWDGDGVPLEDSNMAGVGSEEDKAARKAAALSEPAWEGVGQEPGLWIWRIESFKVVPWPKAKYGTFHEGDSYIILQAAKQLAEDGSETDALDREIFFWLGKETSTDEKGTAAYKTVELDDFFDGEPTQHREVQGIESEQFNELFQSGISYLKGGVESGFDATQEDVFMTRLYQVRRDAKKRVIIEEEAVKRESLNHRDCFILDMGRKIYTWFGDDASPFLKNGCNMKAEKMESERDGESTVVTEVDEAFWEALGGEGDITASDAVGEEVPPDFGEGVLYSVQVVDSDLQVTEVGRGELTKSMLDPTAVMMLDSRNEILMWLGQESSAVEQRMAFKTASNYLKMNDRPVDRTPISVIKQGSEKKNKLWSKTFSS